MRQNNPPSAGYDCEVMPRAFFVASFVKELVQESADAHPAKDDNSEPRVPEWLAGLVKSYDEIGITMRKASTKK